MLLITEWTTESSLKWLDRQGIVYHYAPEGYRHLETLSEPLKTAVGLVVRNQTPVTSELLAQAPNLKAIGRLGVGLDNINLKACQERGIPVLTARGANAPAVVEYVLGALLWHSRPLPLEMGQWQRHPGGAELHQQNIGVVGFGDIGRRIADVLWMLGATLWVYDPRLGPYDPAVSSHKVRRIPDLETLLKNCDIVTLHAALTPATYHLLNHKTLSLMPDHAMLVNTARGQLIDENALLEQLQNGRFSRVVLDVREIEPPRQPDPLSEFSDRVWLTPHVAGLTDAAQERTCSMIMESLAPYLL